MISAQTSNGVGSTNTNYNYEHQEATIISTQQQQQQQRRKPDLIRYLVNRTLSSQTFADKTKAN